MLAQQGIVVWECDNRTASGKGMESAWPVYRNFGELELRDIEDGLSWLKSQPYIDGSRIGIHGWSYGGFLTSYALTHSTSFVDGHRRRHGLGLAQLRLGLHRALYGAAGRERRGLPEKLAALGGGESARCAAADPRADRR